MLDALVKLNTDLGLTIILSEHRLERVVQYADRILYVGMDGETQLGTPRDILFRTPLAPPVTQVGKLLNWTPLPLTIKEGRRFVQERPPISLHYVPANPLPRTIRHPMPPP